MSTKGVVDVVLCIDASASMQPCFQAVQRHFVNFVRGLESGNQQQSLDLRIDYLAHSCGENGPHSLQTLNYGGVSLVEALYHGQGASGLFTKNMAELEQGLGNIQVEGDEAPLIAMDTAMDFPWRQRNKCHRVLIFLTDEAFETGTDLAIQRDKLMDVIDKLHALGILLFMVAPDSEVYRQLSMVNKCKYNVIDIVGDGLQSVDFAGIMEQIGKSVSTASLQSSGDRDIKRSLFGQSGWSASNQPLTGA